MRPHALHVSSVARERVKAACQAASFRSKLQLALAGLVDGSRITGSPSARVWRIARADSPPLCAIASGPRHLPLQARQVVELGIVNGAVEAAFAAAACVDIPQAEPAAQRSREAFSAYGSCGTQVDAPDSAESSGQKWLRGWA